MSMTYIETNKLHTDDMIRAEVMSMIGDGKILVTLGMVERLWCIGSPYIKGGQVEPEDVANAMAIVSPPKAMDVIEFHEALIDTLETAWRAFEIIVPEPLEKQTGRTSEIALFTPEWLSDVISSACHAMPSLTYHEILWKVPLTLVLHLNVSMARRNGVITERPNDIKDALSQFRSMRRSSK